MKKLIVLVLSAALCFCLCACSGAEDTSTDAVETTRSEDIIITTENYRDCLVIIPGCYTDSSIGNTQLLGDSSVTLSDGSATDTLYNNVINSVLAVSTRGDYYYDELTIKAKLTVSYDTFEDGVSAGKEEYELELTAAAVPEKTENGITYKIEGDGRNYAKSVIGNESNDEYKQLRENGWSLVAAAEEISSKPDLYTHNDFISCEMEIISVSGRAYTLG